ncbi:hypothetical protein GCM10010401_07460 [Rarobacter faecitabidus]|uniref:Tail protein n=1 Tax=Rarobacter faecitabidus TaxID=13243 RepID=A0A542ZAL5_RARFA|nr:hypothetical protein [Rarobacter faecitabidus]TQL57355.1 hypothetical protein FB461_2087 [Rarobacter faecitabidus]
MSDYWGWFGVRGRMVPIKGAQAGLPVTPSREGRAFVPPRGLPRYQVAPHAARSWGITLSRWSDPSLVSLLRHAAMGTLLDPCYLYTADSAAVNLLSDSVANPYALDNPLGASLGGTSIPLREGDQRVAVWTRGAASPWTEVPILPGVQYQLSATTDGSGALFDYAFYGSTSGLGSGSLSSASAGSFHRSSVQFTSPAGVAYMRLRRAAGSSAMVSGPRLVEVGRIEAGDDWYEPGMGVPMVQVEDPQYVIQSTAGGRVKVDFTVNLREVQA